MTRFLSVLLCSASLTACGGGGGGSTAPTGATPPTANNTVPVISGTASAAIEGVDYSFIPTASDADGDTLTFSITGKPGWADFSTATGAVTGMPGASDVGTTSNIKISVSDGKVSSKLVTTLSVDANVLEKALRTADASEVPDADMIVTALNTYLDRETGRYDAARAKLFSLDADGTTTVDTLSSVSWDPTWDTGLLAANFGFNTPVLRSNASNNPAQAIRKSGLAIIGETEETRYMVMGSNPFRTKYRNAASVNADMDTFMLNSLAWLTGEDDLATKGLDIVFAHDPQSYYFPDQVANRAWFKEKFDVLATSNDADACDGDKLSGCITSATDLLVVSTHLNAGDDVEAITAAVVAAMEAGVPVLYTHYDGGLDTLAKPLLKAFNVTYVGDNYFPRQIVTNANPQDLFGTLPDDVAAVKEVVKKLQDDSFTVSLANCDDKACPDTSTYRSEFLNPALIVKSRFNGLDKTASEIFDTTDYRYEKLLILLADVYRRDVTFPMDKVTTPRRDFLKSMFADHAIYNSRPVAPVQPDMGNFSRSDFSHVTPISKTLTLTAKPSFRSTGAYAIPGQTFTVKRTDNSDVDTTIFINTLRSGATHEFNDNGYRRPKHTRTASIALKAGEAITLTSTHGGPIQVSFSTKDVPVTLEFTSVGEHPYWTSAADDANFTAAMAAADYDWAELVTTGFEVHSKTDKMQKSLDNAKWGSAAALAAATERYMSNLPHVLAGFQGPGIDKVAEIHDFAAANGIDIETLDKVKHMNADQATCGAGCSGNPYDAYWSFSPISHGDIHELGHGLERGRFRFSGWEGHAVTNPYSYYAKSIYRTDTNANLADLGCQNLPFQAMFDRVQQSQKEADPFAYMQAQATGSWNQSVVMTIQMMMAAQDAGVLDNGWHMLARQHIVDRAFNTAVRNDASWIDARNGLGFAGMSRTDARALNNDDWLLIVNSHVLNRDMRNLHKAWGLGYSDAASAHVAARNFTAMPVQVYASDGRDYCLGLDRPAVSIDGNQAWPLKASVDKAASDKSSQPDDGHHHD